MLAELKDTAFMPWTLGESHLLQPVIEEFLSSALRLEKKSKMSPFIYLDEFERTFIRHTESRSDTSTLAPWTILGCSTFLEVAVMYDLRRFIVERMERSPLSREEIVQCLKTTLRQESFWKVNNGRCLGSDGFPEMMVILLSQGLTLGDDIGLQEAVFERLSKLDPRAIICVTKGFYKHSLINLTMISDPDCQVHQILLRKLTWNEYLDLWNFLRRENRPPQSSPNLSLAPQLAYSESSATPPFPMPQSAIASSAFRGALSSPISHESPSRFISQSLSYPSNISNVLGAETLVKSSLPGSVESGSKSKRNSIRANVRKLAQKLL